jgi:hypothetical protein
MDCTTCNGTGFTYQLRPHPLDRELIRCPTCDGSTVTPRTRADLEYNPAFVWLETDSDGNPCVWENHYSCQSCTSESVDWHSAWSRQCDDDCPNCGATHSPEESHWLPANSAAVTAPGEPGDPVYDLWDSLPEACIFPVKTAVPEAADLESRRQTATILAALRLWQRQLSPGVRALDDIATDGGTLAPLDDDEIDRLCEAINLGVKADPSF